MSSHYSSDATHSTSSGQAQRVPPIALRRFRPPISASVFLSENVPADVRSPNVSGKVAEQGGPYLASGNWWDETAWACAEWDLQLENGDLIRAHEAEGTWKIDGIYD